MTNRPSRSSRTFHRLYAVVASLAAMTCVLAACDESSSGDDVETIAGAPSMLIAGTVQAPTAQVALVWNSYSGPVSGVLVTVGEDGSYSLEATQAPPSYAFDSSLKRMLADENLPDPHIADAVVVGLSEGADASALDASSFESIMLGAFVVYVEEPLDPDSFAGKLYGPRGRGYHLFKIVPGMLPREVWAKNGEVCISDEDERCAPDDAHGGSGMVVEGLIVYLAFEDAPPLLPVNPEGGSEGGAEGR